MALQLSTAVRNARLDPIEAIIGTAAKLLIYSGAMPANAAAGASGTLLVEYDLPTDWMTAASGGAKTLIGLPLLVAALAGAPTDMGYFRLTATDGTTCGLQGTVTVTGGGGDLTFDNISVAAGQTVVVNTFTLTDGNA